MIIQAVFDFRTFGFRTTRTFVETKFSSLIRLSDAEFGFSYTAAEQTFRAIAQWHCKTESRIVFCVYCLSERRIPVAARTKEWVYGRSLAVTAGLNPAGGMDVCLMQVLYVVR